jgi:hypothetical protein
MEGIFGRLLGGVPVSLQPALRYEVDPAPAADRCRQNSGYAPKAGRSSVDDQGGMQQRSVNLPRVKIQLLAKNHGLLVVSGTMARAQEPLPAKEISRQAIEVAMTYVKAVACDFDNPQAKLVPLIPWNAKNDRFDARCAVLVNCDMGCNGGSGTTGTNLVMVKIMMGNTFLVEPEFSSPIVTFPVPVVTVSRVVKATKDTLVMEGLPHGPNDANCCPTRKLHFTMKQGAKGNWSLVNKAKI